MFKSPQILLSAEALKKMFVKRRLLIMFFLIGVLGCASLFTVFPFEDVQVSTSETDTLPEVIKQQGVMQNSVTQGSITWTFNTAYEVGQFVNGDYWVVPNTPGGTVTITSISRPHGQAGRDGSMVNPMPGNNQGYDERPSGYTSSLNVANQLPLTLNTATGIKSLVSTVSHNNCGQSGVPICVSSNADAPRPSVRDAYVLTILPSAPTAESFRPTYAGTTKSMHTYSQVQLNLVPTLPVTSAIQSALFSEFGVSSLAAAGVEVADSIARPFIDHKPQWTGRYIHPSNNMPDYGRDINVRMNDALLYLTLDVPFSQKEDALINYIQLGIDYYGVLYNSDAWVSDGDWAGDYGGGHAGQLLAPILFAGNFLGDSAMLNAGLDYEDNKFGDRCQVFMMTQSYLNTLSNKGFYTGNGMGPGNPAWGEWHCTQGMNGGSKGDPGSTGYRTCCTANSWVGAILATHIFGLTDEWGDDAVIEYQDNYMEQQTPGAWQRSWSTFAEEMWDTYRNFVDASVCGDGNVETGEQCDDGDTTGGDGCSATCSAEPNYLCTGEPSVCIIPPPTIQITQPLEGEVVGVSNVSVEFDVFSWTVGSVGQNHINFYLDGDTTPYSFYTTGVQYGGGATSTAVRVASDEIRFIGLSEGMHTIDAVLTDSATGELPAADAQDSVTFEVNTLCVASEGFEFVNTPLPGGTQNGIFNVSYSMAPTTAPSNSLVAFGQNTLNVQYSSTGFGMYAALVRFNDSGSIDVRDGNAYRSDMALPYTAGVSHFFEVVFNVPAQTYTVHVTPQNTGVRHTIASNYDFRTAATSINAWMHWSEEDYSHEVCALQLGGSSPPPVQACGNGNVEGSEQCDDGDVSGGDGCSALCQVESGYSCSGTPSTCSPVPTITFDTLVNNQVIQVNEEFTDLSAFFTTTNFNIGRKGEQHVHFQLSDVNGYTFNDVFMFYNAPDNVVEFNSVLGPTAFATWTANDTITFNDVDEGTHILRATLVDASHQPLTNPEASEEITFTLTQTVSASTCGNTQIENGEQCDDGNQNNGDGCSSTCATETSNSGGNGNGGGGGGGGGGSQSQTSQTNNNPVPQPETPSTGSTEGTNEESVVSDIIEDTVEEAGEQTHLIQIAFWTGVAGLLVLTILSIRAIAQVVQLRRAKAIMGSEVSTALRQQIYLPYK